MKLSETIARSVRKALIEDKARADITSKLCIPNKDLMTATVVAREKGRLCGLPFAKETFRQMNGKLKVKLHVKEGCRVRPGLKIMTVKGHARSILSAERTALNYLGYLSGIATTTETYVKAVKPYRVKVLGTRKTTPGNRYLEKYAIQTGGGETHRYTLADLVLIKDNHRSRIYDRHESLSAALRSLRSKTRVKIEVEVDTLTELKDVLTANPDMILLDNMTTAQLKRAVALKKQLKTKKKPLLEASGGITLKNINRVAAAGVDRISTGALTHQQNWIDFSLES